MAPADDRRTALLDRLADHVLAHGLAGSSLRPMARAAGTSDRMLLYYFPTKEALIGATLAHVGARMQALLSAGPVQPLPFDRLLPQLIAETLDARFRPYIALFLELASQAARGDIAARETGRQIAEGFLAWGEARLDTGDPVRRRHEARRLLTRIEGMALLAALGVEGAPD